MIQRIISITISLFCACAIVSAQVDVPVQALWVGQTWTCDLRNVSTWEEHTNLQWTIADECKDYLAITPNGETCAVKVKKYFTGTLSVLSSWVYIPFPEIPSIQESINLLWFFSCIDNPVTVMPTSMSLQVGQQQQLSYSHYNNTYASAANVSFTCSSGNIVTVSSTGMITAKKAGTASVTVHSNLANDANAPSCLVTVLAATPSSITIPHQVTLNVGSEFTLTPVVTPSGADYTINWTSSNTSVATVSSSGKLSAKKKGTATITAKINGTALKDNCIVTVVQVQPGDVNGDGSVNIEDITAMINLLLHGNGSTYNAAADMDQDGNVSITDVTLLIDCVLTGRGKPGDVNNDGQVTIEDVTALIEYVLYGRAAINKRNADMDNDGHITISDVTLLIDYVLHGTLLFNVLDADIGAMESMRTGDDTSLIGTSIYENQDCIKA